ncbi:MAG: hypothetical protein H0T46_27505 [Deltaproteobacteria bacterium]|nr:hypothetical protein [Deltaproteobacteria bacterium]
MRTVILLARASIIEGSRPADPNVPRANSVRWFVLAHVKRILDGLRRDLDAADAMSDAGRATLQHVAIGKASCGLDVLEQDGQLASAFASRTRVPPLRFTAACRALLCVLDDARGEAASVAELQGEDE